MQVAIMRVFSKVDEQGKISIPSNIKREMGLKHGQLVEIKVQGPKQAPYIVVHKRKAAR